MISRVSVSTAALADGGGSKDFRAGDLPTEKDRLDPSDLEPFRLHQNPENKQKRLGTLRFQVFPSGCGSRIWTDDLRVMSPTSYRTALSRDI